MRPEESGQCLLGLTQSLNCFCSSLIRIYVPETFHPGQEQLRAVLESHAAGQAGSSAFRHRQAPATQAGRGNPDSARPPHPSPRLYPMPPALEASTITADIRARLIYAPRHTPIPLPGFYFCPQNYQHLSCYIFYHLFAVNYLFHSLKISA